MKNRLQLLLFLLLGFTFLSTAQNTVGLISYDPIQSFEGYNLIYPHNQSTVYLLDNCGAVVQSWTDESDFRPGNTAYLTEDGLLYKSKRPAAVTTDAIWAGGGGAILEIRDWDNNLVWSFEMNNDTQRLHHDFAVLPNGNIIALAWELKTIEECLSAGRDTSTLAQNKLWPDWVFEINPNNDEIIWEWHSWDHLVQDFDATKANFEVVADHPELIDVNYGRPDGHPDWHHGNALDYHPILDQVLISIPYFDEIWIIDHTTTTAEAAGHTGGISGRGGDLMFRWGNSATYDQGDETSQQLFFQHDAHWIDEFLEPGHPYFGKIGVFNNRVGEDYSSFGVIEPFWDMYEWSYLTNTDDTFLPAGFDYTGVHPVDSTALWSTGLSSVQYLPNGNILVTSGRFGYSFEMTPNNQIVWEYITPLSGGNPVEQGDTTLMMNSNLTFRMDRYPIDFEAFAGKDLSPKGWIELNPNETFCDDLTPIEEILDQQAFRVYPNPSNHFLAIEWDGMRSVDLKVVNLLGQMLAHYPECTGGRKYITTTEWSEGIYFVVIDNQYSRKVILQR
jgi:hypothetical protein